MVIFLLKSFQRVSWDVNWDQDPFLIHLTFKQVQLLVHERPGIVVGDDQFFVNCPTFLFQRIFPDQGEDEKVLPIQLPGQGAVIVRDDGISRILQEKVP